MVVGDRVSSCCVLWRVCCELIAALHRRGWVDMRGMCCCHSVHVTSMIAFAG